MTANAEKCKSEILNWLKEEKIPNARTDDYMIMQFLEGCKYKVDQVKYKMKNFYEMRLNTPEWFQERDPMSDQMQELLSLGVLMQLPVKDDEGRSFVVVRATINNPHRNAMINVFKAGMMVVDLIMELDETIAKNGLSVIIDLKGVSFAHALQMTPKLIQKAVHSWQDCYPIRIHSMDFINCPFHVNIILKVFKQFMRDKLKRRVRIHMTNLTEFQKSFDPKCLPNEYGGECGNLSEIAKVWKGKLEENRTWFIDDVTVKRSQ